MEKTIRVLIANRRRLMRDTILTAFADQVSVLLATLTGSIALLERKLGNVLLQVVVRASWIAKFALRHGRFHFSNNFGQNNVMIGPPKQDRQG